MEIVNLNRSDLDIENSINMHNDDDEDDHVSNSNIHCLLIRNLLSLIYCLAVNITNCFEINL